MTEAAVLVAGSGHLSDRVEELLRTTRDVVRVEAVHPGPLGAFEEALDRAAIATGAGLFIVDDRDAANIQFVLAALKLRSDIPITMALSNERLVPHLQKLYPNLVIVNPWETIVPDIVRALQEPAAAGVVSAAALPPANARPMTWIRDNRVLVLLATGFVSLLAFAAIFFHRTEGLDWITALYFVVTMATTTGFGDISLRDSSVAAKIVGMLTMASAITFVSLFFSLLVDRIIARRTELLLGRRRHALKGHIVVCGLGRLGYHLVAQLRSAAYPVLVIEKDADNRFLPQVRKLGARVMIGDATLSNSLLDAAVDRASAVTALVNDDLVNLEIGLNARAIDPRIRVILRIFDRETALQLRQRIDIHYAISTSAIAARVILEKSTGSREPGVSPKTLAQ